ncbi:MAG: Phospholipase YtpA [Candidatus Omnitrophica bacterium ADurb.Bin277]|nr:MAG: Phospholipase YtpA [Candidatus Omnitrophica bacterium ADurb.Bin277]
MSEHWIEEGFQGPDGVRLLCRIRDVPNASKTLLILHGYGEHSGRYVKFAEKLKVLPLRIAVMNYRGMGTSADRDRSEEARDFDDYLSDVTSFARFVRNRYRVKGEFILLGHSLGGLVALEWARRNPKQVKRLILSAPFLGFPGLGFWRSVNRIIGFLLPDHIYRNPVIPKHLSHDPEECRLYRADPLIKRRISARLIGSIFDRIVSLRRAESIVAPCPVILLLAGKDRVVDTGASRKFFDRLIAPSKECFGFDDFYHEIFNETGQDRAFNVLKTILEECV